MKEIEKWEEKNSMNWQLYLRMHTNTIMAQYINVILSFTYQPNTSAIYKKKSRKQTKLLNLFIFWCTMKKKWIHHHYSLRQLINMTKHLINLKNKLRFGKIIVNERFRMRTLLWKIFTKLLVSSQSICWQIWNLNNCNLIKKMDFENEI